MTKVKSSVHDAAPSKGCIFGGAFHAFLALAATCLFGCASSETARSAGDARADTGSSSDATRAGDVRVDGRGPRDASPDSREGSDGGRHDGPDQTGEGGKFDEGGTLDGGEAGAGGYHCPSGALQAGCPDGAVDVLPDADLQALVSAHDGGTTFCLEPGTHHDNVTSLKSGDTFTSPTGTTTTDGGVIENGAQALTGWTEVTIDSVKYWTTSGGSPLPIAYSSSECEADYPGCFYSQDLFVDGTKDYIHVTALGKVTGGTWYFDYAGGDDGGTVNNVYLADSEDPNSHSVELSRFENLFSSSDASSVVIQGLIVEKYGARLQSGAIVAGYSNNVAGSGTAKDWVIQNNVVRYNHGGISLQHGADHWKVLCNDIDHDGTVGFGSGGTIGGLFAGNTIAYGNQDHEDCGFECVEKVTGSDDCSVINQHVFAYNTAHDNRGPGLWSDVCARHVSYDHNAVYNNDGNGIRVEISEEHTVTNNVLSNNGTCAQGSCVVGQGTYDAIICTQCSSTTIANNFVSYGDIDGGSTGGIEVDHDYTRDHEHQRLDGGEDGGFTVPVMMSIVGNTVVMPATGQVVAGSVVDNHPDAATPWITPRHVRPESLLRDLATVDERQLEHHVLRRCRPVGAHPVRDVAKVWARPQRERDRHGVPLALAARRSSSAGRSWVPGFVRPHRARRP